jgi:hypothetical protein
LLLHRLSTCDYGPKENDVSEANAILGARSAPAGFYPQAGVPLKELFKKEVKELSAVRAKVSAELGAILVCNNPRFGV